MFQPVRKYKFFLAVLTFFEGAQSAGASVCSGLLKEALFDYGVFHDGAGIWTGVTGQLKLLGTSKLPVNTAP